MRIELLYWDGCPSHPDALRELNAALSELGHGGLDVVRTRVDDEEQAERLGFVGSPTIRVEGTDPFPPGPDEPPGLACRVYRLRDGRFSPTPDPAELRASLRELLAR